MSGHTRKEIAAIKHLVVNDLGLGNGLTAPPSSWNDGDD